MLADLVAISRRDLARAIADILGGLLQYRLWHLLAWQEIRSRYRRSTLGPFWLTITMAIQVVTMGVVVTYLFAHEFGKFLPYVTAGLIVFSLISGILNEGATSFLSANAYILQIRRPFYTYICQTIWKNLIVGAHSLAVFVVVAVIYEVTPTADTLFLILSLPLFVFSLSWMALLLALLSTRFRDIPAMVSSLFTLLFWIIPLVYYPEQLGDKRILVEINPFTHILEILRQPLLGAAPSALDWSVVAATGVVGWAITLVFYARFRARVPYWL